MGNLSIEKTIVKSGLFYFDDGYLGSTNHGAGYYHGYDSVEDMDGIKDESGLRKLVLDKNWEQDALDHDDDINSWDEFFDKWFSDCDEAEIIEDSVNGGNGYGKIVVNKEEKYIKIMVVPCLYTNYGSNKDGDIKIFGFDWKSKELIREIDNEKLSMILEDEDYYIG
jgi:hypothetical protein